jgi:hypothetical protein
MPTQIKARTYGLLFALVGLIVWQTRNSRRENASRLLAAA